MPVIYIDGWYGISIQDSTNIEVANLEIIGPNLEITGEDASANRLRIASHNSEGELVDCGLH